MTSPPRAARWTAWFTAWIDGTVGIDDATAVVLGDDAAHDVLGLTETPVPLEAAWLELRRRGVRELVLALPAPGDPVGLGGPADFNGPAIDAGEAVVAPGVGLGFVPSVVGRGVFWNAYPAHPPTLTESVAEAERQLREQLIRSGHELAALDVARWRPEVADALATLREPSDGSLPPGYDQRAQRVAVLAERCLRIGDLALADDGASVTTGESDARRRAIEDLCRAARHAAVSAYSPATPRDRG